MKSILLTVLGLLVLVTPSLAIEASDGVRLDPDSYHLTRKTLSDDQKMRIYLSLIENFIGWAETGGFYKDTSELETNGGFFEAAGRGVSWPRGNAHLCMAYATLLNAFPDREHFTIHKIPRAQLLSHLRKMMRALCITNKNFSGHLSSKRNWGGPSWQTGLEFTGCTWAAILQKDALDPETLSWVREVACKEADIFNKPIPSRRFDDTGAEDCCWNTAFLAVVANAYADDPRSAKWDFIAKKWALNGVSAKQDASSAEVIDGTPLKDWIVSENIHPDLTIENHGFWSTPYQVTTQHFGEGALAYRYFGKKSPEAYSHHSREMWEGVTRALYTWDGDLLMPHGQDWAWKAYSQSLYLAAQATTQRNAAASAFESRAIQMAYRRQLSLGTGEIGTFDFGNQTVKPKRWSSAYLMHRFFPGTKRVSFPEADAEANGFYRYEFEKTAIHRNPKKLVSVSWHPRSQAILIFPEGDSTFTDPPFFFPYEQHSGNIVRQAKCKPILKEASPLEDGNGMRVTLDRVWEDGITQHVSVISLDDEATVYCTAFEAVRDVSFELPQMFPLRTDAPPGFKKPVKQYRGSNWLNMSDHVGFVSSCPLPEQIPSDRFFLSDKRNVEVKAGKWFGDAILVVYARQSHKQTASSAKEFNVLTPFAEGKISFKIKTSTGEHSFSMDFAK